MLRELDLAPRYRSSTHNLLRDFYVPCLRAAVTYDRAVGFFSSYALSAAAAGLPSFIAAGGRMRLIASPELSPEDVAAINAGYRTREAVVEEALVRTLEDEDYPDPIRARLGFLAWMVAENALDIKIAIVVDRDEIGIYHEKPVCLKTRTVIASHSRDRPMSRAPVSSRTSKRSQSIAHGSKRIGSGFGS